MLDADTIAHKLYRPYSGLWKAIVNAFGEEILKKDDTINRVTLGKIVFNASEPEKSMKELERLNKVVHPFVKRQIENDLHRHFRRQSDVVVIAALWDKLDMKKICDKVILLKADEDVRRERIRKRDGISADTYNLRASCQKELADPDFIIENNGTIEEFKKKLENLKLSS